MLRLWLAVIFILFCQQSQGTDQKRETEFAELLNKSPIIGKPFQLDADGKKFLALYAETAQTKSQGTVILLHDMGGHPNQAPVIANLRSYLPEHNWTTLSIQLPLRESGSEQRDYYPLFPEALARIKAAVKYAKDNGSETVVLIGNGIGALMGLYALNEQAAEVSGFVAISLPAPKTDAKTAQTLEFIKKVKAPMLDIYSAFDNSAVIQSARDRKVAGRDNAGYRQILLNDENRIYGQDEGLLVKRVYSWLAKNVDPVKAKQE
jgi:alpha-beta hydrolase superfamily lysophospholipase